MTERAAGQAVEINGEVLVVTLASNPATGYGWQAQRLDTRILRQLNTSEWVPDTPGKLGGSGMEVLRFAATSKGQTTLNLVYVRPWEMDRAPARTFSLEVTVIEPSQNVSYPPPDAEEQVAVADAGASPLVLPAAYNWCDLGGCTPVRDQGNCGS